MSFQSMVTKSKNFCGNSIKRQGQLQMAKIIKLRGQIQYFTVAVGAYSRGGAY